VWLADDLFAEHGNLVGADDQMSGVAGGQCAGFRSARRLTSSTAARPAVAFVDIRRAADERQVQAGEQFAAIGELASNKGSMGVS
jgi:hypothetical protein